MGNIKAGFRLIRDVTHQAATVFGTFHACERDAILF